MDRKFSHSRDDRNTFVFNLDIFENDELLGQLGDISENGLMMIAEKPFQYNKFKKVRIALGESENFERFSQDFLDVDIEVRWMKPDHNPRLQRIGCRFLNLNAENLPLIMEIQNFLNLNE
ncbi:MAG: PilZ domain-containing protein [Thiomargarita sp.]|nr:PilZ domain-containing protein [Thiomargarita sp.]